MEIGNQNEEAMNMPTDAQLRVIHPTDSKALDRLKFHAAAYSLTKSALKETQLLKSQFPLTWECLSLLQGGQ